MDRPIRIFHGTADDWTPVSQCRQYVDRMRQAGKDVVLIEYPGAHHGFDRPSGQLVRVPDAISPRECTVLEIAEGQFVYQSGRPFTLDDPCLSRGATVGGNDRARLQALQDVTTFLRQVFKLGQ